MKHRAALRQNHGKSPASGPGGKAEPPLPVCHEVVVQCVDEAHQQQIYERMTSEGYRCRLLTL